MNLVVGIIWWGFLKNSDLQRYNMDSIQKAHLYLIHIIPQADGLLNTLITDCVLYRGHQWHLFSFGVSYLLLNFTVSKFKGEPIYLFLRWDLDTQSIVMPIFLLVGLDILF